MSETSNATRITRRRILAGTAGLAGSLALRLGPWAEPGVASARQQVPVPQPRPWTGAHSDNGWPVVTEAPVHAIEGTDAEVALLEGDVVVVLLHVARRLSYEIAVLRPDEVTGHRADRTVAAPYESNVLSGTAITIREPLYPIGVAGGLYPQELVVVRDALADCDGVVRWGGDLEPAKESHFQIDVPPGSADLARAASTIRSWGATTGVGAGATDPLAPGRRNAARALERQQSY